MTTLRTALHVLLVSAFWVAGCATESGSGETSTGVASTGSTGTGSTSTGSTGSTGAGGDTGSGGSQGPGGAGAGGSDGSGGDGSGASGSGGAVGSGGSGGSDGSGGGSASAPIAFGANWQGASSPEAIGLCEAAGVSVERHAVRLADYDGGSLNALDALLDAGVVPLVNVNWEGGGQGGSGQFVGDTPLYRSQLRSFLDRYGEALDVIVIENEPATEAFYTDDLNDYIAELKAAVEVVQDYRDDHPVAPKIADGGIHVLCIEAYSPGADAVPMGGHVCDRQNFLIHQYAEIPGLDYVTIHFSVGTGGDGFGNAGLGGPDGLVPQEELLDTSLTILEATGHQVLSNEWSTGVNTAASIESVVAAFRYANEANGAYPFAVVFSGDGDSDALPLHSGGQLNALGQAYRDAIASP